MFLIQLNHNSFVCPENGVGDTLFETYTQQHIHFHSLLNFHFTFCCSGTGCGVTDTLIIFFSEKTNHLIWRKQGNYSVSLGCTSVQAKATTHSNLFQFNQHIPFRTQLEHFHTYKTPRIYQNSIHFPQEGKPEVCVCVYVGKSKAVLKYNLNLKCWWKLNTLLKMLNTDTFAPSTTWSLWWWMFLFNIFYCFPSMPVPFTTSS